MIFLTNLKFPAHYMDPNDLIILSDLASCLLLNGNASEAFKCAESVLKKVKLSCYRSNQCTCNDPDCKAVFCNSMIHLIISKTYKLVPLFVLGSKFCASNSCQSRSSL